MPHQGNVQEATTGVSGQGAGNARCYTLRLKAQCVTNSARRANHFPIYGKHVKPLTQKYSAFQNTQISGIAHPSHPAKGRIAIVTRRAVGCGGMRWTLWRQAALLPDETSTAYGEVVWSRRRDRGVYPCRPVLAWQR